MPIIGATSHQMSRRIPRGQLIDSRMLTAHESRAAAFSTSTSTASSESSENHGALNQRNILTAGRFPRMVFPSSRIFMSHLVAYVDGGSHGNPGPSGIGVVIEHSDGGRIRIARWIGQHDNNVAEYAALLEALQYAFDLKAEALHVFSDSEVMVRQMKGEYACRSPRLYSLHWVCQKLARSLEFSIAHVRREDNAEANCLANSAVRKRFLPGKPKAVPQ